MKRISAKLRDASGVSMVLALGIMMVVSIVCVSTLKVASSAPRAAYAQQDLEQSYLAATSAAKLIKHVFDSDKDRALQLLQKMDESSTDYGITNGFSEDFQLQLSNAGADAGIVNKLSTAKVTLTKTADDTVTVSISDSGYPAGLSLSVETVVWPSYPDTTNALAKTTYPNGYPAMNPENVTPPEYVRRFYENLSYVDGSEIFFFDNWSVADSTVSPQFTRQALCKIIWLDAIGGTLSETNYGEDQTPPDDPAVPEKASAAADYYEYRGSWTQVSSEKNVDNILVTKKKPTYETIVKKVYTIQWLDSDSTILDTKQATVDAQEPVTDKIPVKGGAGGFYRFTGWGEGSMSGDIKTYTPQFENTPSVTTKTVIWLDGNGSELERKYYPAGGTEPTTDKTPTKAPDDTWWSYTFTNWDGGTITGDITTYTPIFTGNEHKYFIRLMNGDGSVLYTHEYHSGDSYDNILNTYKPTLTGCTFSTWGTGVSDGEYVTVYNPTFTATVAWRDYQRGVGGVPLETPVYSTETYTVGNAEPAKDAPAGYRDELHIYTGDWTTSDTGYSKTYTATFKNSHLR